MLRCPTLMSHFNKKASRSTMWYEYYRSCHGCHMAYVSCVLYKIEIYRSCIGKANGMGWSIAFKAKKDPLSNLLQTNASLFCIVTCEWWNKQYEVFFSMLLPPSWELGSSLPGKGDYTFPPFPGFSGICFNQKRIFGR